MIELKSRSLTKLDAGWKYSVRLMTDYKSVLGLDFVPGTYAASLTRY